MDVAVLTLDQRASRRTVDGVPELLDLLSRAPRPTRPFQRTAGDEVQGVLLDAASTIETVGMVLRAGGWNIGLGVGAVEEPLPEEARAGRGAAYVAAREAVTRAKGTPHRVAVVGADPYRGEQLETVIWLWAGLLERRSTRGWEVHDLLADGLSYAQVGERLGISQSAVSQRAQAGAIVDERRARTLATQLLDQLLDPGARQD